MIVALLACAAAGTPAPPLPESFWPTWGDGNAELASYDLVQPRYGEARAGTMVNIVVTEDFSHRERVKADPGEHADRDIRKVVKLNSHRQFQTGVYPYSVLTSAFLRVDAGDGQGRGQPLKIAFSAQEWCGMVYDEMIVDAGRIKHTAHTYFDSDNGPPQSFNIGGPALFGDAMMLSVRELTGSWVPAEATAFPYFPSSIATRFAHRAPEVATITVHRGPSAPRDTALGRLDAHPVHTAAPDGVSTTYWVEDAWPHRLLGYEASDGEVATIRGLARLPYWQLNHHGGEARRADFGLDQAAFPLPSPVNP